VVVDPELVIRTSTAPPRDPARPHRAQPAHRRQNIGATDEAPEKRGLPSRITDPFKVSFD
jgi:hypothetical protein